MLKRYNVRDEVAEWAIIVIDTEAAYFSTVSTYGNYAHIFHPDGEFRQFLTELDAHYLQRKLMLGRSSAQVYDGEATKREILRYLAENYKSTDETFQRETAHLEEHDPEHPESFSRWVEETALEGAFDFRRTKPEPQSMFFCTKMLPVFQEMLRKELAAEAKDLAALAQVSLVPEKPA
jgi:hypothetical protein